MVVSLVATLHPVSATILRVSCTFTGLLSLHLVYVAYVLTVILLIVWKRVMGDLTCSLTNRMADLLMNRLIFFEFLNFF